MSGLTKREKVLMTLERQKTGYIPVIVAANAIAIARSPYSEVECRKDPQKFADAVVSSRQYFGLDALWAGMFKCVNTYIAGGLLDKNGHVSENGDGTVNNRDDMKKLRPFVAEDCEQLSITMDTIAELKRREPEEPVITAVENPSMTVSALMGPANYFSSLITDPLFVQEMTEFVFEPLLMCTEKFIGAGSDIIWLPLPIMSGTCISREHYERFCTSSNKRFNQAIKKKGAYLVGHTCGKWNDRFDIVTTESVDCLHISAETDLAQVKSQFGQSTAFMGQLHSVFTMKMGNPKQVKQEGIKECLIGAVGGGFILSADCALPPETHEDNIFALIEAAREAEQLLEGRC